MPSQKPVIDVQPTERATGRVARNRIRIAWMYYVEGLTQNEIADRLGIGRVTVVRNINEAIKQREVKIWIEGEVAECTALEAELKSTFKLQDAVVVPEPSSPQAIPKAIGNAAGMYVSDKLHDNMSIGVGWGATLFESLQTLTTRQYDKLKVVSLLGGIVQARRFNPTEFAWLFANSVDADCYMLTAPALVDSPETRKALIEKCGLGEVLNRVDQLDMALLSVGNMSQQSTSFRFGFLSEEDRQSLMKKGAVGDLFFNFYNAQGKLVDHAINARVMSIPVEKLGNVPHRVMISGGDEKVEALLGAYELMKFNALITNEETAKKLIAARAKP